MSSARLTDAPLARKRRRWEALSSSVRLERRTVSVRLSYHYTQRYFCRTLHCSAIHDILLE